MKNKGSIILSIGLLLNILLCIATPAESKQYVQDFTHKTYSSLNELIQNTDNTFKIAEYIFKEYIECNGSQGLEKEDAFKQFIAEKAIVIPENSEQKIEKHFKELYQLFKRFSWYMFKDKYVNGRTFQEYASLAELIENEKRALAIADYMLREHLKINGINGLEEAGVLENLVVENNLVIPEETYSYVKLHFACMQDSYLNDKGHLIHFHVLPSRITMDYYNTLGKHNNPFSIIALMDIEGNLENLESYNKLALYVNDMVIVQRMYGVPEEEIVLFNHYSIKDFISGSADYLFASSTSLEKIDLFHKHMQLIQAVLKEEWPRLKREIIQYPNGDGKNFEYLLTAIEYDIEPQYLERMHSARFYSFMSKYTDEFMEKMYALVYYSICYSLKPYQVALEQNKTPREMRELTYFLILYARMLWNYGAIEDIPKFAEQAVENTVGKVYKIK